MKRSHTSSARRAPELCSVPEDDGPLAVGTLVAGKYEVVRKLAEGGLGIVVLALHRDLNQQVAIKYLKPETLLSSVLVARFRREARLAASLHSEHVVRVFDVGRHHLAGPYMVMEYLEGSDLASVMAAGRVEVATAVDYVLQACDALAEAHALGIVHRDLKPENLFLARRGTHGTIVKVVDFGLSKVSIPSRQSATFSRLTEQGDRFGTPMFMSPEQLAGAGDVDPRSDIWSLGVVLFELLTSELPFEGVTAATLAANIFSSPPRELLSLRPDASPALELVIRRCLAKDPEDRYRDIDELATDLALLGPAGSDERLQAIRHVPRPESVSPPPQDAVPAARPRARARWSLVAAGALLVAAAVAGGITLRGWGVSAAHHEAVAGRGAQAGPSPPSPSPVPLPSLASSSPVSALSAPLEAAAPAPVAPLPSSPPVALLHAAPRPRAAAGPSAPPGARDPRSADDHAGVIEEWDIRHAR